MDSENGVVVQSNPEVHKAALMQAIDDLVIRGLPRRTLTPKISILENVATGFIPVREWTGRDLNPRPLACEASIATAELPALRFHVIRSQYKI